MRRRSFIKNSIATLLILRRPTLADLNFSPDSALPQSGSKSLTAQVAGFVVDSRFEDIPAAAIEAAKKSILDGLGVALAGSRSVPASLIEKYITHESQGIREASIFGSRAKTSAHFAALANGIAMHADDFDDTYVANSNGIGVHPTVTVLPAVMAIAEKESFTGKSVLRSYLIGTEIEMRLAECVVLSSNESPSHPSGTFGAIGSVAACAALRGFGVEQTEQALGVGAGMASGLRANFGSMSKPFAAGHAAENGIVASDLVALGWTGSDRILESPLGFLAREGSTYRPELLTAHLGNPWMFIDPGVAIKPYPSGALTHPAMSEMLRLIGKHKIKLEDVEYVNASTSQAVFNTLQYHRPNSGLQAKFSLEFCISLILLQGRAGIADFSDLMVQREEVQRTILKVRYLPFPEHQKTQDPIHTKLAIVLRDGRTLSGEASIPKGSPQLPMTFEEASEKFKSCTDYAGWPADKSREIVETVAAIEHLQSIRPLTSLLSL